jgi:hypothetical protein
LLSIAFPYLPPLCNLYDLTLARGGQIHTPLTGAAFWVHVPGFEVIAAVMAFGGPIAPLGLIPFLTGIELGLEAGVALDRLVVYLEDAAQEAKEAGMTNVRITVSWEAVDESGDGRLFSPVGVWIRASSMDYEIWTTGWTTGVMFPMMVHKMRYIKDTGGFVTWDQ